MKNSKQISLPKTDVYKDAFEEYQKSNLCSTLNEHYKVLPYYKRYASDYNIYMGLSVLGHFISAALASTLVFFFCLPLFDRLPNFWAYLCSTILTIFVLLGIELIQFRRLKEFWKVYFQFGFVGLYKRQLLFQACKITLLVGVSIITSYYGGQMLPQNIKSKPTLHAPVLAEASITDMESIKTDYDRQIKETQQAIKNAEAKIKSEGSKWEYRLAIIRNNDLIPKLRSSRDEAISNITKSNQKELDRVHALNAKAKAETKQLNEANMLSYETDVNGKGDLLAKISCIVILLVVYASYWKEKYRFKSHAEFVQLRAFQETNESISNSSNLSSAIVSGDSIQASPRESIGFVNYTPVNRTETPEISENTGKQLTIKVDGFSKEMTLTELHRKLKQYEWKLLNKEGKPETAQQNIQKFEDAISKLNKIISIDEKTKSMT